MKKLTKELLAVEILYILLVETVVDRCNFEPPASGQTEADQSQQEGESRKKVEAVATAHFVKSTQQFVKSKK